MAKDVGAGEANEMPDTDGGLDSKICGIELGRVTGSLLYPCQLIPPEVERYVSHPSHRNFAI